MLTGGAREEAVVPAPVPDVGLADVAEPAAPAGAAEREAELLPAGMDMAAARPPEPAPATPPAPDPVGTAAERAAAIRELQAALRTLGHYSGMLDGAAGVGTQGALAAFGREARVSVPGALGSVPLAELSGLVASVSAAAADYTRREAAAWNIARGADTISGYRAYLADFERGPNAGTARAQIAAIDAAARPGPAPATVAITRRAGDVFRDRFTSGSGEGPKMVVLPSGSFTMGSPATEEGRAANEGPQRSVRIGYSFAVGKYEVTWSEWEACLADGGCGGHRPSDEGWGKGNRPMINVNWDEAQSYVQWLSRKTGHRYRLLSEAEWEYAARAGTTTPFHTGATISTGQANYDGNYTYGSGVKGEYRARTVPAGSLPANAFGLHDMHGNVWEWTQDCLNGSYTGAPTDGSAWTTGNCTGRVFRGGSWSASPQDLRSAYRIWYITTYRSNHNGFRVARTL